MQPPIQNHWRSTTESMILVISATITTSTCSSRKRCTCAAHVTYRPDIDTLKFSNRLTSFLYCFWICFHKTCWVQQTDHALKKVFNWHCSVYQQVFQIHINPLPPSWTVNAKPHAMHSLFVIYMLKQSNIPISPNNLQTSVTVQRVLHWRQKTKWFAST